MSAIPSSEDVASAVAIIRRSAPTLGISKVLAALKAEHGDWCLSETRLRKIMRENDLALPHPSTPSNTNQAVPRTDTASIVGGNPGAPDFFSPNLHAPSPVLPTHPRQEQLRYQNESTRCYKIYGRGDRWDYGVTWNATMGMMVQLLKNRMKELGWPLSPALKEQAARSSLLQGIFEMLWPSAQRAGLTREDIARQMEAEWGANPEPWIFYPRDNARELTLWTQKRAQEAAAFKVQGLKVLRELEKTSRGGEFQGTVKLDERTGQPLWSEERNGKYVAILTLVHKGTDIECGDIPQDRGWDWVMPCSHGL